MVKINLEKLEVNRDLTGKEKEFLNIRMVVANDLYIRAEGPALHSLMHKVYENTGETEFDENECKALMSYARQALPPRVVEALSALCENNNNNKK